MCIPPSMNVYMLVIRGLPASGAIAKEVACAAGGKRHMNCDRGWPV